MPQFGLISKSSRAAFRGATASAEDAVTYTRDRYRLHANTVTFWTGSWISAACGVYRAAAGTLGCTLRDTSLRCSVNGPFSPHLQRLCLYHGYLPGRVRLSGPLALPISVYGDLLFFSISFSLVSLCQIFLVPARCDLSSFILLEHLACVSLGTFSIICVVACALVLSLLLDRWL